MKIFIFYYVLKVLLLYINTALILLNGFKCSVGKHIDIRIIERYTAYIIIHC